MSVIQCEDMTKAYGKIKVIERRSNPNAQRIDRAMEKKRDISRNYSS